MNSPSNYEDLHLVVEAQLDPPPASLDAVRNSPLNRDAPIEPNLYLARSTMTSDSTHLCDASVLHQTNGEHCPYDRSPTGFLHYRLTLVETPIPMAMTIPFLDFTIIVLTMHRQSENSICMVLKPSPERPGN